MIEVGSDFSGVGALDQALLAMGIPYKKQFVCDYNEYARQSYVINYGTAADKELVFSKEHKQVAKKVTSIIENDEKAHLYNAAEVFAEAEILARKFSFYYPFNVYNRVIPEKSLDFYITSPPCQGFSMAGKREGSILFFNSLEFIAKNNPRYFIFENVKGLLSHEKDKKNKKALYGKTFQEWLNFLGGKSVNGNPTFFPYEDSVPYHIYFQVINAKDHGVPQNRERVFIIGIRDDSDNNFSFPKPFPLTKRLKDVLETDVDEKYFLSDTMINGFINHENNAKIKGSGFKFNVSEGDKEASAITTKAGCRSDDNFIKIELNQVASLYDNNADAGRVYDSNGTAATIKAEGGGGSTDQFVKEPQIGAFRGRNIENPKSREKGIELEQTLEINKDGVSNTLTSVQKDNVVLVPSNTKKGYEKAEEEEEEEDSINFSNPNSKTRRGRVGKGVAQTLDTACNQGILTKQWIKGGLQENQIENTNGISPCLTSAMGLGGGHIPIHNYNYRIRKLTPTECFRLMDFAESFMDKIKEHNLLYPKKTISDSQLYKQAGNSIVRKMFIILIEKLNLK